MRTHGVQYFLINGGGDLYVDAPEPVEFALENPFDSTRAVGQTRIKTGALAASSSLKRTWQHRGVHHHHIIDPKTEESSKSDVVASFVRAGSALIADTVATIVMIRPSLEKSLKRRYNLQTILVHGDDHQ
jgi:thiamine biosynthesis lipoprotein